MTLRLALILVIVAAASACGGRRDVPSGARIVRVAAAADLKFALDEIAGMLRREQPPIDVQATYGSSGTLYTQIVNSAPFDLFLSADADYPRQLGAQGFTVSGSEFVYARGRLALVAGGSSAIDLSRGIAAVAGAKRIAVANPAHAPYGRAAIAALRTAGLIEQVNTRLVYGENVAQAFQFVQSGAADAGVVALSLVVAPTVNGVLKYVEVPMSTFPPLLQTGVVLKRAADGQAAAAVSRFLQSRTALEVFHRYGFDVEGRP